jgi:regulatory protein
MEEISEEEALCKVAAFCASGERCRQDVTKKLERWGLSAEAIERILARLVAEKYLDEARFCRAFIRDKVRYEKWGRRKIAQALWMKQVDAASYEPLLTEAVDEEEYLEVLRGLLKAKRKQVKAASEYERNGKLIRFALGRGFEMGAIRRCMEVDEDEFPEDELVE